jgi:O-antigen ligase
MEMIERAQKQAVARREMFISLKRLEVNGAYRQHAAYVGARGRLNQDAAGGRIFLGKQKTDPQRQAGRDSAGRGDKWPPRAQKTEVAISIYRLRHRLWDSVAYMAWLLAVVIALIPLSIAPGLLFYFDVTPKTLVLCLGTAVAALWWALAGGAGFSRTSRVARWFTLVLAATAVSLAVSTLASAKPAMSFSGSTWRRWGLIVQLAVLALAYLVAAACAGRPERLRLILRAITVSGLLTALYGAAQYFGWDPVLPKQVYHAGEGIWTIVRPPSTLGHADYFGGWLLCAIFAALALVLTETARFWKWLGWVTVAAGCAAVMLSGTRSALLGLACGAVFVAFWRGVRVTRRMGLIAGFLCAAGVAFYLSPVGAKLRARVHWSAEEPLGGGRLWLWRDSLRMAAARWPVGYGPDIFTAAFPRWQSAELARTEPDFFQESPHNVFLDALVAQGLPGLILMAALCAVGFRAAWELKRDPARVKQRELAGAVAGGLAAMTVSHQFACFIVPTGLAYLVLVAILVALTCHDAPAPQPLKKRWALVATVPFAGLLAFFAVRLLIAERATISVSHDLNRASVEDASADYDRFEKWRLPGPGADLWYSRRLVELAQRPLDPAVRSQALREALIAAVRATRTSDAPFNAYYNLAAFYAGQNDFVHTEQSLRSAIASAPNWFKPHWMLAQVLAAARRWKEAEAEAELAARLSGGKFPEVVVTLQQIRAQHK